MCANIVDLSRDEAKRILRRLELEAYSAIVSAFRAQGELGREKKKLLTELGTHLCISTERHRAEVRRAYSDDRLLAISESVYGPGSCAEWAAEGRRTVPLMPRLVPQTVLTATATAAANTAAANNDKLPTSSPPAVKIASSGQSSANSSPGGSTTSSTSSSSQQSTTKPAATSNNQQASSSHASDTENENDGRIKKRRRLSTSMTKPVPKIITPTTITKPATKTATVSTMTKVGKPVVQATMSAKPAHKGTLPASASQVKLLTKTVAITPTLCQAKTVLTYKTVQTGSTSPVKVQTVTSSAASKTQFKPALPSSSPSKSILVPKPHGGTTAVVSKSVANSPGISKSIGNKPTQAIKPLATTTSQLAARQRLKPPRFKTLPGTVKFKSVTPVTVGTSSVVTMVTPSPGTTASSGGNILSNPAPASQQPYLKVIQVPVTGVVGNNKPVVVMSTAITRTTVSSATTTQSVVSKTQSTPSTASIAGHSVLKIPISIAPAAGVQSSAATSVSSTAKSVVMTTVVGGTKRVVLSVPAYSLAHSKPVVTSALASVATSSASDTGTTPRSTTAVTETDSTARGQEVSPAASTQSLGMEAVTLSVTQSSTQIMPKHVASTLTTQVRSRPLPAILPAPPKPTVTASNQPGNASTTSGVVRKLATILPAPAKNVTVIQPVLLPVQVPVTASTAGQLGTSLPLVLTSTIPSIAVTASDGVPVHSSMLSVESSSLLQEPMSSTDQNAEMVLGTVSTRDTPIADEEMSDKPVSEKCAQKQPGKEDQPVASFPDIDLSVIGVEPNSSAEDDTLLLCSETLDLSTAVQESTQSKRRMIKEAPVEVDLNSSLDSLLQTSVEETVLDPNGDKKVISEDNNEANTDTGVKQMLQKKNIISNVEASGKLPSLKNVLLPAFDSCDSSMEHAKKQDSIIKDDSELTRAIGDSVTESLNPVNESSATILGMDQHKTHSIQLISDNSNASEGSFKKNMDKPWCSDLERRILDEKCGINTSNETFDTQNNQAFGNFCKDDSTTVTKNESIITKKELCEGPSVIVEKLCDVPSFSYSTSERLLPLIDPERPYQFHPKDYDESGTSVNPTVEILHGGGNGLGAGEGVMDHDLLDPIASEEAGELIIEGEMCRSSDEQGSFESFSQDVNVDILSVGSSGSSNDSTDKEMTDRERKALEAIASVRTSGRKRKAPMALDVSPPRPTAGWIRSALSLLQKVCSYRGQGRRKGDFGAASWFLRPVDPSDAPGYYKIIKTPMDFSTIKGKLESGQYQNYTEFYADMLLVKTNCQKYNPPGHEVRQDCDEVFRFFDVEYAKMLERWEKCHTITVSPAKKVKPVQPKTECVTK